MKATRLLIAATVALGGALPAMAEPNGPMLAQACAGCHGQSGAGMGSVPELAGFEREAFIATWEAFRNDERPGTIMNRIARGYTEDEVAALADYFSAMD